ncbi:hypothetical protein, partial [Bacillus mesophilum]|uniref:hypothetical protein n=1 Tax=Bacillus mesophilum TaxID=1071718 RepID=UPI001960CBA8
TVQNYGVILVKLKKNSYLIKSHEGDFYIEGNCIFYSTKGAFSSKKNIKSFPYYGIIIKDAFSYWG